MLVQNVKHGVRGILRANMMAQTWRAKGGHMHQSMAWRCNEATTSAADEALIDIVELSLLVSVY
jgi:hypothetical protein